MRRGDMSTPEQLELDRLREALASATRAREVLLAGVAHDLRNPLNTFAMSTGLLKDDLERNDVDAARALSLVRRMERATTRMQQLIEDLIEGSRVEAGKIDLARRSERIAAIVEAAVEVAKPLVAERSATIAAGDVEPALEASVDRARVVQAIAKATAFVLRGTGDGGRITVSASTKDGGVEIAIHGKSPGEGAVASTPPDEGRGGLALLIARGLAAAHGGSVAVSIDDGVRVAITLPAD